MTARHGKPTLHIDDAKGPDPLILKLCDVIRQIPRGRVCTYGRLAAAIGRPRHARWVGRFLSESPLAESLPWHRVVNANGTIALRNGAGPRRQWDLLKAEKVEISQTGRINLDRYGWMPKASAKR